MMNVSKKKFLPAFVKENFQDVSEIVLGLNCINRIAQVFIDEGVRVMGRKDELIIMKYYL
jgi:hypothetical protein